MNDISAEIERVANVPVGMRSDALFSAAYRIAIIAGDSKRRELTKAAIGAGLCQAEIDKTIDSALRLAGFQ